MRYALHDEMEVTGFLEKTPCLRFVGRRSGIDLVGEKLDTIAAAEILNELSCELGFRCVSLLARVRDLPERPHYVLLVEGAEEGSSDRLSRIAGRVEGFLSKHHHYRLARELGQLHHAEVIIRPDALRFYHELRGVAVAGARKIEPVVLWKNTSSA